MRFFQLRLVAAMLLGITLISAISTYFDVLAHKHLLRKDLQRRAQWFAVGIRPQLERTLAEQAATNWSEELRDLHSSPDQPAILLYNSRGEVLGTAGEMPAPRMLPGRILNRAFDTNAESDAFVRVRDTNGTAQQWYEDVLPLHGKQGVNGALVVLANADWIRAEGVAMWQRSFWRIAAMMVVIVTVTLTMVRFFLYRPIQRAAEWLRRVRHGEANAEEGVNEFGYLVPLAREVTSLAENLRKAREAAKTEAVLRNQAEGMWTSERLAAHVRERLGNGKLFVVSNREPYAHIRQGRETHCITPSSGVVTAIEPILLACDGIWIAHGSGDQDFQHTDAKGRLRVPPHDERYTLRRIALSADEQAGYYEGFANEGLWPLCHIAHTRPVFRASDWEYYRTVNRRFADALLEEMEDTEQPVVLVQDYHFALVPGMIEQARPDARVAIFWHIPWPNAEAFGICPWQAELLDGLLGADLIGFHLQSHCNNFMDTVDRVLEARTDWQDFSIRRRGHLSAVRPYPISVAWNQPASKDEKVVAFPHEPRSASWAGPTLDFIPNIKGQKVILGVDRMDYTKGIPERLLAIEQLLAEHSWYEEQIVFIQIAVPSRSTIPAYARLKTEVEEMVERINLHYQTPRWKPVILVQRQCNREELQHLYRRADLCLVTSLHDGMNLVAKEYLEARDDCDGVLVLSCFAGAAQELKDALIVNPYDIAQVSDAIHEALQMPPDERLARMERMRRHIKEHNVYRWASDIVTDLCAVRIQETPSQTSPGSERPARTA